MKKKKEYGVSITANNLLYQPFSLAVSGYETTSVMQQNIVIAILRRLKVAIKEVRDSHFSEQPKQLSFFDTEGFRCALDSSDELSFQLHMSEFCTDSSNYGKALNTLCTIADAILYIPDKRLGAGGIRRTHLFDISSNGIESFDDGTNKQYRFANHRPEVTISIRKDVADFVFDSTQRIYDFVDDTAMMITNKYSKRIYMYLSNFKYVGNGHTIDYWEFRRRIGINDNVAEIDEQTGERKIIYPYYSYFNRKVLKEACEALKKMSEKDQCDFYFDYEPSYKAGNGRAKNPDQIKFTFHLSDLGKNISDQKGGMQRDMALERLLVILKQSRSQIAVLLRRVDVAGRDAFIEKCNMLIEELNNTTRKNPIEDIQSWANVSLTRYLDDQAKGNQPMIPFEEEDSTPSLAEIIDDEPVSTNIRPTDEDNLKWELFLELSKHLVGEEDFDIWFKQLALLRVTETDVYLGVPTFFFCQMFEERFVSVIYEPFRKCFGQKRLMYNVVDK